MRGEEAPLLCLSAQLIERERGAEGPKRVHPLIRGLVQRGSPLSTELIELAYKQVDGRELKLKELSSKELMRGLGSHVLFITGAQRAQAQDS